MFSLDLPNELDLNTGEYVYYIYENGDSISFDYDSMNELEVGRANVVKEFPTGNSYTISTRDKVNYGG